VAGKVTRACIGGGEVMAAEALLETTKGSRLPAIDGAMRYYREH